MKEKKKISWGMVISILVILIVLLAGGFLLYKNHTKIVELEDIIAKQKVENEEIIAKNLEVDNTTKDTQMNHVAGTNETEQSITPSLFTSNAKKTNQDVEYSLSILDDSKNFRIRIKEGVPTITTVFKAEQLKEYGVDISKIKINEKEQKINGFTKKVVDACTITDEHQLIGTTFVFLMEDGTLEYSKLQNMIENISTQGSIKELKNIIKLQKVELSNPGWEDTSAIAIDKDNNYYDVSEYIN